MGSYGALKTPKNSKKTLHKRSPEKRSGRETAPGRRKPVAEEGRSEVFGSFNLAEIRFLCHISHPGRNYSMDCVHHR